MAVIASSWRDPITDGRFSGSIMAIPDGSRPMVCVAVSALVSIGLLVLADRTLVLRGMWIWEAQGDAPEAWKPV